jgi:hypothetical protein
MTWLQPFLAGFCGGLTAWAILAGLSLAFITWWIHRDTIENEDAP